MLFRVSPVAASYLFVHTERNRFPVGCVNLAIFFNQQYRFGKMVPHKMKGFYDFLFVHDYASLGGALSNKTITDLRRVPSIPSVQNGRQPAPDDRRGNLRYVYKGSSFSPLTSAFFIRKKIVFQFKVINRHVPPLLLLFILLHGRRSWAGRKSGRHSHHLRR